MNRAVRVGQILLLLALVACRTDPDPPRLRQIVLITVDTLRADRMGCYGYAGETSPGMDDFARQAVLFRQTSCQAPWTVASFASLMSGRMPSEMVAPYTVVNPEVPLLAEVLREGGLRTYAVVANPNVRRELGFHRGFDRYDELFRDSPETLLPRPGIGMTATGAPGGKLRAQRHPKVLAPRVTRAALELLPELADRDFFLWVLYMDPHSPYIHHPAELYRGDPPLDMDGPVGEALPLDREVSSLQAKQGIPAGSELERRLQAQLGYMYDGEVRFVDREVRRLLSGLEEAGILRQGLTILTSDHGESLLDHEGYYGHGRLPYEPAARVPLLVRWPGGGKGEVEEPVSLMDLFPTLLDHCGLPIPPAQRGRRLTPEGPAGDGPVLLETTRWEHRALRQGPFKLVAWGDGRSPARSLFYLPDDPGERADLASTETETAADLAAILDDAFGALLPLGPDLPTPDRDPEVESQLRALGYLE